MMKGVAAVAQQMGVPCQVSLEERMGCGTGGCVGCACQGKSGTRYKVCKDGPVFPAEEVFFLMATVDPKLAVEFCGISMKNPIVAASGTFWVRIGI